MTVTAHTRLLLTVYMNQRDVTPWATAIEVSQPARTIHREWSVTFVGWSSIEDDAEWDIFGSYDPADPRAECLIRAGVIPPDRMRNLQLGAGAVPQLTVQGVDHVWMIQRRAPRDTVVMLSEGQTAAAAIEEYGQPVGRYTVWSGIATLHHALEALGTAAGVNVLCRIPNYPFSGLVVDPTLSYWGAMYQLLEPTAAEVWYRRSDRTLVCIDPLAPRYGLGRRLELPAGIVKSASAWPIRRRRVRRIIYRVPPCR